MEIREIVKEMERKLEVMKPGVALYEGKVTELQKIYDKAKADLDKAVTELKTLNDDVYALEQSVEMLKMTSLAGQNQKMAKPEPKKEAEVEETYERKKDIHKRAHVLKLNEFDNIIDNYASQKAAARAMKWDQSGLSKFMRLSKDVQLRKKGFYLAWEY